MSRGRPFDPDRLADLVRRFRGVRVAVAGDLVCDEFVHGEIARVSREAPVLILEHAGTEVVPGGAANAAVNLRALGARPVLVGIVGRDDAGDRLLAALARARIDLSGIGRERGYATPAKSRVLAGGLHTRRQQIVRIDRGARHGALPPAVVRREETRLRRALGRAAGLLIADYGYGAATPALLRAVGRAIPAGAPVMVDSRARVAAFRGVTACSPNQEEVENALGLAPLASDRAVLAAGKALLTRTRDRAVLVTRGAAGMVLFEPGARPLPVPAFGSGEVADVTGAGDTVIAVFTLARIAGGTFAEAASLANVAAGLVVMKYGTAVVTPDEVLRALGAGFPR